MNALDRFDHPVWLTAAATLVSYALILGLLFGLLFVVPFVLW